MNLQAVFLLATLCTTASAFAASPNPVEDSLALKGMTRVSEGLYAKVTVNDETTDEVYIATNRDGEQGLLSVLEQDKQRFHLSDVIGADPGAIDSLIDQLNSRPPVVSALMQDYYGDCNGVNTNSPWFHVNAAAGKLAAHALAENNMPGPVLNTTNKAFAEIRKPNGDVINTQSSTTFASTDAAASVTAPAGKGCTAVATASVTCPGGGGISAYASSVVTGCIQ